MNVIERNPATDGVTAAALLDRCLECENFHDDVNGCGPIDPPCLLARQRNVCTWREMAGQVAAGRARHPDAACPWNLETGDEL